MSIQGFENKVTASQVGGLLQKKLQEKSVLDTSLREYTKIRDEVFRKEWVGYGGSLQYERSIHYKAFCKAFGYSEWTCGLTELANTIFSKQDLYTKLRAKPERFSRLIQVIEKCCHEGHYAKIDGCRANILNVAENIKTHLPKTIQEVKASMPLLVEAIGLDIKHQMNQCISLLEVTRQGLLEEEKENVSLRELRLFLRSPKGLELQKFKQKLLLVLTDRFFYSHGLIKNLVSRVYKDPRFSQIDKSTLLTREKLLAVMMIQTLCGNQQQHQLLALKGSREGALVPAVRAWNEEFNFIATAAVPDLIVDMVKDWVERFDVGLIGDLDGLIFKVITGEESGLSQDVVEFLDHIKVLARFHSFNYDNFIDRYLNGFQTHRNSCENLIMEILVQHALKDLESLVEQKIEECKVLLSQELSQNNLDALLKILVDLYTKGYRLELKHSIFPLFSENKDYPFLTSFVELLIKCENYYEAYDFSLLISSQEQKEMLVKQCLQKIKEDSERFLKENYFWASHTFLLSSIADFYMNGQEKVLEPSISCLFSSKLSLTALSAIKKIFDMEEMSDSYTRFRDRLPEELIQTAKLFYL